MTDETPETPAETAEAPKKRGRPKVKKTVAETRTRENFEECGFDHEQAFEVYYQMGAKRSFRGLEAEINQRFDVQVAYNTLARWARAEKWGAKVVRRDVDTGVHIAEALARLAEKGELVSAATFKGVVGTVLEAVRLKAIACPAATATEVAQLAEVAMTLDKHAAEMSAGTVPSSLNGANGHDDNVVKGRFAQVAREKGFVADGNGKDVKG